MILYSNALDLVTSDWIASKVCDSTSCDILFFVLLLYVPVNSYGQGGGRVSSPNHTFSCASLNKRLTSNLCA